MEKPQRRTMGSGQDFWDQRYEDMKDETDGHFDWYAGFDKVRGVIEPYIDEARKGDSILILGCGSSRLGPELYEAGYRSLLNVDISSVVIRQMQDRYAKYEGMHFNIQDVRCMDDLESESFTMVVDKGTMDALFCATSGTEDVKKMCGEVSRVLAPGGRFVVITHGTEAMRKMHLTRPVFDWNVEHTIIADETQGSTHVFIMEKHDHSLVTYDVTAGAGGGGGGGGGGGQGPPGPPGLGAIDDGALGRSETKG